MDVTKVGPSEFSSGPILFVCQPTPECNRCLEWISICIIPKNWNVYKVSRHSANIIDAFYGIIHFPLALTFLCQFRFATVWSRRRRPPMYTYTFILPMISRSRHVSSPISQAKSRFLSSTSCCCSFHWTHVSFLTPHMRVCWPFWLFCLFFFDVDSRNDFFVDDVTDTFDLISPFFMAVYI